MDIWESARPYYQKFARKICFPSLRVVCLSVWLFRGICWLYWLIYSVLGPIIGGYLSDPETLLAGLIKRFPFLKRVPFAVPLVVCGILCFLCRICNCVLCVGSIMTYLWVDETLPEEDLVKKEEEKKDVEWCISVWDVDTEYWLWCHVKGLGSNCFCLSLWYHDWMSIQVVAIEGVIQGTYDTVLPVWLASEESVGGFDLDKKDLGWVLSFVSPMQMATCMRYEL